MLNRMISGFCFVVLTASMGLGTIKMDGNHEYKAVELEPYIYNQTQRDLKDILILDNNDNAVPYFIHNFEHTEDIEVNYYNPVLIYSFSKDNDRFFDFYIEPNELEDIKATSLIMNTDQSYFAKNIELFGSFDGDNWSYIKNDKIYAVEENENLEIFFDKAEKYTYYRIKIFDNIEEINITNISLVYSETLINKNHFLKELKPEFEIIEEDKETIIRIHGVNNLKINEITINTESQFKRDVWFDNQSKVLYNLKLGDNFYNDTTIPLDTHIYDEFIDIKIFNGDDEPIKVNDITLNYFYDLIIFKSENGKNYRLLFGDSEISSPPTYDIVNYKDLIIKEGYDILTLENFTEPDRKTETEEKDYRFLFNVIIISVSVILAFIIVKKLVIQK